MTPASYRDIEEQRKQDAAEAEENLRAHCHIPERATTPLAQMSPDALWDELYKVYWNSPCSRFGDALASLIQRATREAREGYVDEHALAVAKDNSDYFRKLRDEARAQLAEAKEQNEHLLRQMQEQIDIRVKTGQRLAEAERERDTARALADRLQGERDTLAWDVGVAERKLAGAGREAFVAGAYLGMGLGSQERTGTFIHAEADRRYPPSPREAVPSVTEEPKLEAFDVEVKSYLGGGVGYLPITPAIAKQIVALATGGE